MTLVRLAGIHGPSVAEERMLKSAKARGIVNPWEKSPIAYQMWNDWWEGKLKSKGQVPSEMFLWYLVAKNRNSVQNLLGTPDQMKHLPIVFRGSTEEALDIYCAQLRWSDENGGVEVFPTASLLQEEFDGFAFWIEEIFARGLAGISVDKYKQVALMIAALVEQKVRPQNVSHDAWDAFGEFIRTPRQAGKKWLVNGYPEQKGRWGGDNGQFAQCNRACELVEAILKKHP